ncbi:DUF2711 family protein [Pinibacter soli]|uniref:DUF2711 family protein n=1 Tax=Pinibacter soli TaxID=3044211 RepID=A0ABT6RIX6_9BACT|nr:DUF2711 family protein [Pinibacter soli]MDI3321824.1 DUF2711 family protein [Pinibacter soli]
MDIFTDNKLHPGHDTAIKPHYKEYFDTVFIAFSPFFKLNNGGFSKEGYQRSQQISFDEAQTANELFQKMPKPAADIYSYNNESYPDDDAIYEKAEQVSWNAVKEGCGFQSFDEINRALKTSIGAYRRIFKRADLAQTLSDFATANQIYYPTEGHFEVLSKKQMLKAFRMLAKENVVIEEQFGLNKRELNIASIEEKEFVDTINFHDYFIYDASKELLFAVDWDDFFFLICSNRQIVDKLVGTLNFEGFYCDDTTESAWDLTREEIEAGLQIEKQRENIKQTNQLVDKKPWWKFW